MLKAKILLLVIVGMLSNLSASPSYALEEQYKSPIKIIVNNKEVITTAIPIKQNDLFIIPVRPVFEALGYEVNWSAEECMATLKKENSSLILLQNSRTAIIQNKNINMITECKLLSGKLYVPLNLLNSLPEMKTEWAECLKAIFIFSNVQGYKDIAACRVKQELEEDKSIILLDVRTEEEHNQKFIPNSIPLPLDRIETEVSKKIPDRNTKVIVYCKAGTRSAKAADILIRLGYTNVSNMVGGINLWKYETESKK